MTTTNIFNIVSKAALTVLCVVSAACVVRITNKAIGTMNSVDKVCKHTNEQILPSVNDFINKASTGGVPIKLALDEDITVTKEKGLSFFIQFKSNPTKN